MQIDFHHATTYVLARLAGFKHPEANIIAYSAQYVDDATNSGIIHFTNGAMYKRFSSAHKMLDYRNFDELANHRVWIPFHFLPGNGGLPAGENPTGRFIEKIICRPDSPIAKDMVNACIMDRNNVHGLHRLGITMHVYADTWAHQGFAGVNHRVNDISKLENTDNPDNRLTSHLKEFFQDKFDQKTSKLIGDTFPLGHGAALSFPDRPYLKWCYKDHNKKPVVRDNTAIFLEASNKLCMAMQRFLAGDVNANVSGLQDHEQAKIETLFRNIQKDDGKKRHKVWLQHISDGYFGFQPVKLEYKAKGVRSWKHEALGTTKEKDDKKEKFKYDDKFLQSNWKLFHDALLSHRFYVIHNLLPQYGICAA
jgi:uncharacterized protein DUF6765